MCIIHYTFSLGILYIAAESMGIKQTWARFVNEMTKQEFKYHIKPLYIPCVLFGAPQNNK